ncbi:hypothetical protein D9M71_578960 [compost metagenome]
MAWEEAEVVSSCLECFFFILSQIVAEPAHGAVHASPAHLLFGYLFADCRFSQARRTQVSSCLFVDHDDQVAQCWHIGRSGR